MVEEEVDIPLHSNGQLPRSRDALDDNVALLHPAGEQLGLGALKQRLDDAIVPAGVDDADAQSTAVVGLRRGALGFGEDHVN